MKLLKQIIKGGISVCVLSICAHGQDLANGLLGHWPLDGNFSDISGNARHANLSNVNGSTPGFTTGKIFKAVDFDGTDDYLSVPHDSGIDLRRTISFSSWLKLDSIPTNTWSPFLYKGGSSSSLRTYTLWLNNTSRYFHGTSTDSQGQQNADSVNNSFAVNEWMNLVLLVDRNHGFIRVYKNNSEVAVVTDVRTTDTVSNSNPLLFGSSQETNSGYVHIDGQFDDLRLYNRILSTTEIAFLFNAANTDTDSDGLTNAEEELLDTNVSNSDSDGDGLTDFEEVNGFANTYEQINGSFTWAAAKADAESKGGYLATITSSSEKNAVEQVRTQNSWLGASDVESEGNWKWVTGEPWSYTSWNNGEPNGGTGENYLLTWTSDGNWNDSGSSGNPYILEKVYYSDPTSIDTDGDGYSDYNESQGGTDPNSYDSSPLATGLVGHWKFDETSGNMASDSSGNNYHAQLFGATDPSEVWATGKIGGAIQLDGSNHYLAIQSLHYNQAGQIPHVTTAAWVKTSQASEGMVMSFDRSEYWRFAVGGSNANAGKVFFASSNANSLLDVYGQTSVSDGVWHHIAASYSTSDGFVRLYVDGTLDHSQAAHSGQALGKGITRYGTFSANNEDTSFNTPGVSRSMKFNGLIDDARIYNRALSASEVSILAGVIPSTNASPTNLALSNPQVTENQPVGTTIGLFSATDADGDALVYQLVSGTGDSGNALFNLDANGTLKTGTIFDYENNATSYSLRVRVRDDHNASLEGNFTITIQNQYEQVTDLVLSTSSFAENLPVGSIISSVLPVGLDAAETVSYTINPQFPQSLQPVFWIDADHPNSLWQDTGGTVAATHGSSVALWQDRSGNGKHVQQGSSNAQPLLSTNVQSLNNKNAVSFTNDFLSRSNDLGISGNHDLTLFSVWSNATNNGQNYQHTFHLGSTGGNSAYGHSVYRGNGGWIGNHYWGGSHNTSQVGSNATYIAISHYDASTDVDQWWINGQDMGSYNVNLNIGTSLTVGSRLDPYAEGIRGDVAEIILFDTVLDQANRLGVQSYLSHKWGAALSGTSGTYSNNLFSIESNGSIRTVSGFDYENNASSYLLEVLATDSQGATFSKSFSLNLTNLDESAPVITLIGGASISHEVGSAYVDPGATWADDVDGTGTLTGSGQVDGLSIGTYTLTFSFSDNAGNAATTVTRTIHVGDSMAPILSLNGGSVVTHEAGMQYSDPGASWTDYVDGSGSVAGTGQVDGMVPGTYTISYNKTDSAGNAASSVTRTVNVVDTTPPILSLLGQTEITLGVWQGFLDPGFQASDGVDGNLTSNVTVSGLVNPELPGSYTITYSVADNAANQAVPQSRVVTITNQPPNGIELSASLIEENLPVGTFVGQLSTSDPDDPNGLRIYTYELVGSDGNESEFFEIDQNASLITSSILDYEESNSSSLTIRAYDEFGASFVKDFTINVRDAFAPLVKTVIEQSEVDDNLSVNTQLLDSGGTSALLDWGVLASPSSIFSQNQEGVIKFSSLHLIGQSNLETVIVPPSEWSKIFVRAYARNAEGAGMGVEMSFDLKVSKGGEGWARAEILQGLDHWWESPWWGTFYQSGNGWVYHSALGWVFPSLGEASSVWMWKDDLGWLWTKEDLYPFFYSHDSDNWTYFMGMIDRRITFFDYESELYIKLPISHGSL